MTSQLMANPLAGDTNSSLIAQVGTNNQVVASQTTTGYQGSAGVIGNTQATFQVGTGNYAMISQAYNGAAANTAVTAQYGSHNSAIVAQK
jgi:hypothetical protein